ncbi:chemotaxis protein CheB [Parasedimentitalea maritima]|uniref:protein-glutamate methylesterase n=1 Tax=Parasedimentitalea maritima TaxID=2578117 RepID=A0A5R8ZD35_9RHOB|nr:CheB methylesterase domain-containing protein [Zongyanglinia marina]KAE9629408.1 chemotaxis protein CheB [Zongyanglinia marina]TLP62776.1 chemotaxis protein CheB [Zongyanglinia marina]
MESAYPGMQVLLANNLMTAYNQAESVQPTFAFIEDGFTKLPEFEMMMALFSALDTRWVSVMDSHSEAPARKSNPLLDRGAGIFELSKSDHPVQFVQYFDMMVKAPRRTASGRGPAMNGTKAPASTTDKIILIGSSTGGVEALRSLLVGFPANCPPTVIVQHTGKNFGPGLVALLNRICAASVVAAQDSIQLQPGTVHIAAGQSLHLGLTPRKPHRTRLKEGPPISGHTPSVDALFSSAVPFAKNVVATILTGMGQDGARGLLELRKAGATTFAQDEKSSVVYGMPRVAWQNGAAQKQVSLARMAGTLLQACKA